MGSDYACGERPASLSIAPDRVQHMPWVGPAANGWLPIRRNRMRETAPTGAAGSRDKRRGRSCEHQGAWPLSPPKTPPVRDVPGWRAGPAVRVRPLRLPCAADPSESADCGGLAESDGDPSLEAGRIEPTASDVAGSAVDAGATGAAPSRPARMSASGALLAIPVVTGLVVTGLATGCDAGSMGNGGAGPNVAVAALPSAGAIEACDSGARACDVAPELARNSDAHPVESCRLSATRRA